MGCEHEWDQVYKQPHPIGKSLWRCPKCGAISHQPADTPRSNLVVERVYVAAPPEDDEEPECEHQWKVRAEGGRVGPTVCAKCGKEMSHAEFKEFMSAPEPDDAAVVQHEDWCGYDDIGPDSDGSRSDECTCGAAPGLAPEHVIRRALDRAHPHTLQMAGSAALARLVAERETLRGDVANMERAWRRELRGRYFRLPSKGDEGVTWKARCAAAEAAREKAAEKAARHYRWYAEASQHAQDNHVAREKAEAEAKRLEEALAEANRKAADMDRNARDDYKRLEQRILNAKRALDA